MGSAHQEEKVEMTAETQMSGDILAKVNGKTYRCECGANVFRWIRAERLRCNGCSAVYEAVRTAKEEKRP